MSEPDEQRKPESVQPIHVSVHMPSHKGRHRRRLSKRRAHSSVSARQRSPTSLARTVTGSGLSYTQRVRAMKALAAGMKAASVLEADGGGRRARGKSSQRHRTPKKHLDLEDIVNLAELVNQV